jgi:hypothetical protein
MKPNLYVFIVVVLLYLLACLAGMVLPQPY